MHYISAAAKFIYKNYARNSDLIQSKHAKYFRREVYAITESQPCSPKQNHNSRP